jgi:hypothetical protein
MCWSGWWLAAGVWAWLVLVGVPGDWLAVCDRGHLGPALRRWKLGLLAAAAAVVVDAAGGSEFGRV